MAVSAQRSQFDYWSCPEKQLLQELSCREDGLTPDEASVRQKTNNQGSLHARPSGDGFMLFLRQFKSPVTLILVAAAILSFFLGERADAFIIFVILLAGAILGYYQERGAASALRRLLQMVQVRVTVIRDGQESSIPVEEVVPGDIVSLNAGQMVPGDCRILSSKDLYANEASLTGETFPAEKKCGPVPPQAGLSEKRNILFMGTHVISGTARALVVHTGGDTEFGNISRHLRKLQPETEFERGIRRFGYLLLEVTLLLIVIIFSLNIFLHKPVLDSFLFSLAIAVGLTPQLLPAIISINLAKGATRMAEHSVIVKKLSAIENFGSMNVLCTDKTGTITTGEIIVHQALNIEGREDKEVVRLAWLNASFETGFNNPIDTAIKRYARPDVQGVVKLDEIPYDFIRRRLSILVGENDRRTLITKGAFEQVLSVCSYARDGQGHILDISGVRPVVTTLYNRCSEDGFRVLGVAYKQPGPDAGALKKEDEREMIFAGLLLLTDPPKEGIAATLNKLHNMGIAIKIITGDNALVARQVSKAVGLDEPVMLTGAQIREMSTEALIRQAARTSIFAAIEPNQKERILLALKKAGNVVGFMGDGINDAPALHSADVGISVHGAADVAREAADIVLLGNDLDVLVEGVVEGRKTFANTLKYIFMATSANFGNMFSMAGASVFLPYLPLLPKQVLLTNLLTDIPEMTIATDTVDTAMVQAPRRLDIHFIRQFMILFGIISSLFDYITFAVLLYGLHAGTAEFRTGWFIESVVSASLIVLVVRTSGIFYCHRPGRWLLLSTFCIIIATLLLPLTPLAGLLGFTRLPLYFYSNLTLIVVCYMAAAELAKRLFYRRKDRLISASAP
ncbi:MAG TPA: magnesium-translocating P-type ATPase [Puia sp.]|nr:magnesium-translocating P-type ATPase [Puia sp.]